MQAHTVKDIITPGTRVASAGYDMVVEIEKNRRNIHSFLEIKRFLEKELSRKIDLGFEHSLKPIVREKIKGQIIYV